MTLLYHGTSKKRVPLILRHGFLPATEETQYYDWDEVLQDDSGDFARTIGRVFFSLDSDIAMGFAMNSASRYDESPPVVFVVSKEKAERLGVKFGRMTKFEVSTRQVVPASAIVRRYQVKA